VQFKGEQDVQQQTAVQPVGCGQHVFPHLIDLCLVVGREPTNRRDG
jgi:hypothetical protein